MFVYRMLMLYDFWEGEGGGVLANYAEYHKLLQAFSNFPECSGKHNFWDLGWITFP